MIIRFFRMNKLLALCAMAAGVTPAAGGASFRVIYNNQGYNQPSGLIEGSPGVFYSIAGSDPGAAFSVTILGSRAILGTFSTGIFQSLLLSGPNGRFYSSIYTGVNNVLDVYKRQVPARAPLCHPPVPQSRGVRRHRDPCGGR